MRFGIEGETGHGDGGIIHIANRDHRRDYTEVLPVLQSAPATEAGHTALKGFGVSYSGTEGPNDMPAKIEMTNTHFTRRPA